MRLRLLFICLILFPFSINAQISKINNKNTFSFKAGFSIANFTGEDVVHTTTLRIKDDQYFSYNPYQNSIRKGITLGIGYHLNFSKQFSLLLEANYEEKGSEIKINEYHILGDFYDVDEKATFILNYFSIPALLRIYAGDLRLLYFEAGIYYSMVLIMNETGTIEYNGDKITYEYLNENMSNEDFGISLGTGLQAKLGRFNSVGLGVRYSRSFMGPAKYHQMDPTEAFGQYLVLSLSYLFRL